MKKRLIKVFYMSLFSLFLLTIAMICTFGNVYADSTTIDVGNDITTDGEYLISDNTTLTGYYNGYFSGGTQTGHWLRVAAGATVTFNNINILEEIRHSYERPNIIFDGDATVILVGVNKINGNTNAPCITVREGCTLTIKGSGSLLLDGDDVYSQTTAIGAPFMETNGTKSNCGNFVFESGTITATANTYGYAIGGVTQLGANPGYTCGDIIIGKDAKVTATIQANKAKNIGIYDAIGECNSIQVNGYQLSSVGTPFNYPITGAKIDSYISEIPAEITLSDSCYNAIKKARIYYNCSTETEQAKVTKLDILVAAELAYAQLTVSNVPDTIVYTSDCESKIIKAREAYDVLSDETKQNIDPAAYQKLTDAEAIFASLKAGVEDTLNKIDAIGTVDYNNECKAKIDAAREAYDDLTAEQKAVITNYNDLTSAEAEYANLKEYYQAADNVAELIEAIGTVQYSDECKANIDAAREAYEALDANQQSHVSNYNDLTSAEAAYEQLQLDHQAANQVKDLIANLGNFEYSETFKDKLDDARDAYDLLTDNQKTLVDNVNILTSHEDLYNDINLAVIAIDGIGNVTYTEESKAKIDVARAAYNAVDDNYKSFVTNFNTLKDAEDKYIIRGVEAVIDAIGEVEYTLESKAKIDAAKEAYDNLDESLHDHLNNVYLLVYANQKYNMLDTTAKIDAIGEVTYTEECKARIDAAKAAYDNLGKLQANIENYALLEEAEATYAKLKVDNEAADAVTLQINAIGEVTYTNESKAKIDAAKEALDNLTDDQKALISEETKETLTNAETTYAKLKVDNEAADAVTLQINAIGEVTYTAESKAKIDAAKEAFDNLTDDQKALISNQTKETITNAETTYAKLKADKEAADAVTLQINAIGEVTYTDESKAKINAAKAAFEALTDEQKQLVTNLDVLEAAETTYAAKAPHGLPAGAIVAIIFGVILLACGIFLILWFFVWKKTWKELGECIKNIWSKIVAFFKKVWNKFIGLFKKKDKKE